MVSTDFKQGKSLILSELNLILHFYDRAKRKLYLGIVILRRFNSSIF